jgi:plastocyanin domain-containing protein
MSAPPAAAPAQAGRKIEIQATDAGFSPREVRLKQGQPTTLVFAQVTYRTCIKALDIPEEKVKKFELPLNQAASLTVVAKKAGVEAFHCSAMGTGNASYRERLAALRNSPWSTRS